MTYTWQPEKIISTDKLFKIAKAYVLKKHTLKTFEQIGEELGVSLCTVFNYCRKAEEIQSTRFLELVELEEKKLRRVA